MNIIFDFDGTIADTMPFAVEIIRDWNIMDGITFEQVRKQGIKETFKQLDIPKTRLMLLLAKGRKKMSEQIEDIKTFKRIPEVLDQLKQEHKLGVLTSNSVENVNKFLEINGITVFDFVDAELDLFGKANKLKRILKRYKLDPTETIYVGDETRDIEAAKKVGIKSVAVSWGYEATQILEKSEPDIIVHSPQELLKIA